MVAVGVLGIVTLGVASLFNNLNSQSAHSEAKADRIGLQRSIESMLQRQVSCGANLLPGLGSNPTYLLTSLNEVSDTGTVVSSLIPGLGVPINPSSRLRVSKIEILGPGATGIPQLVSTTAAKKTYLADLKISFEKPDGVGIMLKPLVLTSLNFDTTLSGNFLGCRISSSGSSIDLCTQMGLYWDEVNQECLPSPERICAMIGGVMNNGNCIPPTMIARNCPTGQFVTGFDATGTPNCATTSTGSVSPPTRTCRNVLNCRCYIAHGGPLRCNMDIPSCYSYSRVCD